MANVQVEVNTTKRLLFIGFGKINEFHYFDWEDAEWLNAADFDATFINCGSLYKLLLDWADRFKKGDPIDLDLVVKMKSNLSVLQRETLKIINSKRSIFTFAVPNSSFTVGEKIYSGYKDKQIISVYDWCPLPVETHVEKTGEVLQCLDNRFANYSKEIKRWIFTFNTTYRDNLTLPLFSKVNNYEYKAHAKHLVVNLSLYPLCIDLSYNTLIEAYHEYQIVNTSGSVFLLHFPIDGDIWKSLQMVVSEFFALKITKSLEPDWIAEVAPPHGTKIDTELNQIALQIATLNEKQEKLVVERQGFERWRKLIYETDNELESIVIESLTLLGMQNVRKGPQGDWDIEGEFENHIYVFEVKGLNGESGRKHVYDLGRHVSEYESKNSNIEVSKAVLVANTHRQNPFKDRNYRTEGFADDTIKHGTRLDFALLNTRVLYQLVTDLLEGRIENGHDFLRKLLGTTGIYQL